MGSLVILHLVFFHGILDHSNPELETAFSEAGAQTSGEQVVLLVNAHGLAWPSENGECRLCWHIEGEIIDTVLVYGADGDIDELQKSSEQGTLLMVVELEHWVEGYSDSQNSEINSLGEVIWSGEYYHANTRLVKL
jgi:hypothetical protein